MDKCILCSSENITPAAATVYTAPYFGVTLNGEQLTVATASTYCECQKCGTMAQENRKQKEWYDWFYSSGTYRETLGISQEAMDADEERRANDEYEYVKPLLSEINSHIDIGASRGYFTKLTANHGITTVNYDLNTVYGGAYKAGEYTLTADLVSAIHVLEHVYDPIAELNRWIAISNRYLLIEVPGKQCKGGPLRFAHLWYFDPDALLRHIESLGLTLIKGMATDNTRMLFSKLGD